MTSGSAAAAPVVAAAISAQSAVEGLLVVPLLAASPAERLEALCRAEVLSRQVEAFRLRLVRALDIPAIGTDGLTALGATTLPGLLSAELGTGAARARADVAAARATDAEAALDPVAGQDRGTLPGLGAALAAGEVSRGHVDTAVRTMDKVPVRIRRAAAPVVDGFFVEVSRRHPPRTCENLAAELLDRLDPARAERGYDPDAHLRRRLDLVVDGTGMVLVRGQLDPLTGAAVKAAIDHHSAPDPTVRDQDGAVVAWDTRTPSQRRADALGTVASASMARAGTRAGEPPRVVVHTTVEQLAALSAAEPRDRSPAGRARCEQTGPLDAATLERVACDPVLQRVLLSRGGAVLDLGRTVRLASPAQRRALAARDRGCVVPGCARPPSWCDAHHVQPWHRGGRTALGNLVLLCPAHHSAVHAGSVAVRVRDGVPWVLTGAQLPAAVRTPWAPARATADDEPVRRAAAQTRLALDVPAPRPRPHPRT
jgi:hypothetical protein